MGFFDRMIDRLAKRIVAEQTRPQLQLRILTNSHLGFRKIGDVIDFYAATELATGLANDADSAPSYVVYEAENATQIVTTTSMSLLDSGDTNGLYSEEITVAEATGYEFGKDYLIYITATVSSIAAHAFYTFRVGPEHALLSANAQAGAAGTITLSSSASTTDDLYNGLVVAIVNGTGAGQSRVITDYVGSTRVATIEPNWTTNPSSSSIFALYPAGRVAVQTDGITAASIATGAIDADAIADGAIDAGAIATGAIDADAIADGAIDAGAIANGAIDAATFAAGAIDAAAIANGAIDAATFAAGAIDAAAIANGAIDAATFAAGAIDAAAIADGAIDAATFAAGAITAAVIATGAIDADAIADDAIDAGAIANGAIDAATFAAGAITAAAIATDAIDADALANDAVLEIQAGLATAAAVANIQSDTDDIQARLPATLNGGRMRSHVEAMDAGVITAAVIATGAIDADALATDAAEEIIAAVSGTADSGTTTTLVDAARTEADADYWTGSLLYIKSGSIAGQIRRITDFDPTTDTITVDPAFTQAVSTNDYLILRTAIGTAAAGGSGDWTDPEKEQIRQALGVSGAVSPTTGTGTLEVAIAGVQSDTNDIQTRLPATLNGGRMRSHVEALDADVITAAVIANGAIDAATFAAGAIDAAAVADGAIDAGAIANGAIDAATFAAGAIDAAAIANGAIDAATFAAGAITAAAIATDAIDADALANDAVLEIQSGLATSAQAVLILADTGAILSDTNDIQTRLPATLNGGRMRSHVEALDDSVAVQIISFTTGVADGGTTTTLVDAALTQADVDYWKGSILLLRTGAAAGQLRLITDFDPTTDTLTVDPAFTQAVAAGVEYSILRTAIGTAATGGGGTDWTAPELAQIRQALGITGATAATTGTGTLELAAAAIQADTNDLQARVPAALHADGGILAHVIGCDPPCQGGGGGSGSLEEEFEGTPL